MLVVPALTAIGCGPAPEWTGQSRANLSPAQCSAFETDGKITICHATSSRKNPIVKITISVAGCLDHAEHPGDHVAVGGACDPNACLAEGAPCDATLPCCAGSCNAGVCGFSVCSPGSQTSCYDGPAGTDGVGACHAGTKTCNSDGSAYGACTGQVTPAAETCGDGVDNDCDGFTDGCVSGYAWRDLDEDGLQDAGEPPMAGATFTLFSVGGVVQAVAVSDAFGRYFFSIGGGIWTVAVGAPAGFGVTPAFNAGGNDAIDSDFAANQNTGFSDRFILQSGQGIDLDCGFIPTP